MMIQPAGPIQIRNTGQIFRSLTIIFFALLIGQFVFLAVAFFVRAGESMEDAPELVEPFRYLVPIMAAMMIPLSHIIARRITDKGAEAPDLVSKLVSYQTSSIVRFAMHEGPALFGIVAFLSTGDEFFLYVVGGVILLFLLNIPSREKAITALRLNDDEQRAVRENRDIG